MAETVAYKTVRIEHVFTQRAVITNILHYFYS